MCLRMHSPRQSSVGNRDRVHVAVRISEECGMPVIANRDCGLHGRRSTKCPPTTSGRRIERIHGSVFASYKDHSCRRGGLPVGRGGARKSKRPFELQAFDALTVNAGSLQRLKSSISWIRSPPCPDRRVRWRIQITRTNSGELCGNRYVRFAEIFSNGDLLGLGKIPGLPLHPPALQCSANR